MTVDREQLRRYTQAIANTRYRPGDAIPALTAIRVADHCVELLNELEQVERERNSLAATLQMVDDRNREGT